MSLEPTDRAEAGAADFTDRARWLLSEIGTYVLGPHASEGECHDAARRTLRKGHPAFQSFVDSRLVCTEERWPFDLDCAERMTVPARSQLRNGVKHRPLD